MAAGDHLRCQRQGYWHHGIDCGDGTVIHFTDVRPQKANGTIQRTPFAEFEHGVRAEVVGYGDCDAPDLVLERAFSLLGAAGYHLIEHNCEHFARWCKTGRDESGQVIVALGHAKTAAATGAIAAIGLWLISQAGRMKGLGGPGMLSGLATFGDVLGAGATGGLAMFAGAAGGVSAAILNGTAFRDDPHATLPERRANQAARRAAIAGAALGVILAVWLVALAGKKKGLSGPGISSGLAALGRMLGGKMARGAVVVILLPVVVALVLGLVARYRAARALPSAA